MKFIRLISYATAALCFAPGAWGAFSDLSPLGLQVPSVITSEPNPTVTFGWGVTNQGQGTAGQHYDGIYLSTDAAMHNIIGQFSNWYVPGPVAPGAVSWGTTSLVLPIGWSGDYYLGFATDLYNWVQESDESNNIIVAPFKFVATPADLAPLTLQADPWVTGPPNPPLTVVWAVTNLGPGTARGPWLDTLYLTPSLTGKPELAYLGQFYPPGPLAPGEVYWQTNTVRAGVYSSGSYYLMLRTDDTNCLYETHYENNTMVTPVKFTIQPPDLAPLAFLAPTDISGPANVSLNLVWGITNQGAGTALAPWPEVVYLSTNSVLNEQTDPVIDFSYQTNSVPAGGVYWVTNTGIGAFNRSGSYYLIFKTDPYNVLSESDTNNNTTILPIRFTLQQPDLLPLLSQVPTAVTSAPNPQLTLSWGVLNRGSSLAGGWWADEIYLSSDQVLDSTDQRLYSGYNLKSLGVNESYWQTNLLHLPLTQSGSYYLIFKAGAYGTLNESDTSNNVSAVPIQFTILAPNLVPTALLAPASFGGLPRPKIQLVRGITNRGPGPAEGSWYDEVYLSPNQQWDSSATLVLNSSMSGPVSPGATYWATNTVQLPGTPSGPYYLILRANSGRGLFESDYGDNVTSAPIQLNISAPDLVPLTSRVPSAITSGPNPAITLVWGITNQGPGAASGTAWMNSLFLSTNSVRDGTESRLDSRYESGPIAAGEALWLTNSVRLPLTASGSYYMIFEINSGQWLFESDFTNNVVAVPVRFEIQRPDLAPIAFLAPGRIAAEPYPTVMLVWGVTNQGKGEAECAWSWFDQVFVSTNDTLDLNAPCICSVTEQNPVASGHSYWQTNTARLPVSASGTYHLFLKVDRWQNLVESDVSNNVAVLSLAYDAQLPDLAPTEVNAPATVTGPPNPKITYSWGITNQGQGAVVPYNSYYADAVQLSPDPNWHPYSSDLTYQYRWDPVGVGESYRLTNTIQVPVTQSGTFYLVFKTDVGENVIESDYSNNVAAVPVTFNILPPDLAPLAFQAPTSVTGAPNPTITLVWGVTNQGTGPAVGGGYWNDQVYLSQNPQWDLTGTCLSSTSEPGPVAAGGTYWRTNTFRLPVVKSGDYFLLFKTDFDNVLCESNPSNNLAVVPISFEIHPPDLAPLTSLIPTSVSGVAPDPKLTLVWGVTNQGTGAAVSRSLWVNRIYFSETPTLEQWRAPQLGYWSESGLEAGTAVWQTNTVSVPVVESGTYYLFFVVNSDPYDYDRLYEQDYSNNIVAVPVSFEILKPDLVPLALDAPQTVTGPPNPIVTFVWGVTNQGAGPALTDSSSSWGSWVDSLYVSTNATLNQGERIFSSVLQMTAIPPGGCYWMTNSVRVPVVASGSYNILLQADANHFLHESDYSNNVLTIPLSFNIQPPDLLPVALQLPAVITSVPNPKLTLIWGVTNQGAGLAEGNWYDTVYISTNVTYDGKARSLISDYEGTAVPAGAGYWRTNSVLFPVTQSGTYYLTFQVNSGNSLIESDVSNNFLGKPVTFTIQPPDLTPLALQTPASISGPPNPSFEIAWGVTNQGVGAITQDQSWVDRVYLCSEPKRTRWTDPIIAVDYEPGPLAPEQSYWRSQVVRVPVAQNGTYYLVFSADDDNSLFESDETNNMMAVPVTFQVNLPDLAPLGLQAPGIVDSWPNPTIQLVWGVTNQGSGPAIPSGSWLDSVFLSRDPVFSYSDPMLASRSETGPVPPGGSYWRTLTAQVPVYTSGDYYLIFQTDTGNSLAEASDTNNTVAVPVHFNISVPDLAPMAFIVPTNVIGAPNSALTLVCGVTNQGAGTIPASASPWVDRIFLSTNSVLDRNAADVLTTSLQQGPLSPGAVYWRTNRVPMPVSRDGAYYLFYEANSQSANLAESDYSNNVAVAQVSIQLTPPDIVPFAFLCPTQVACAFPSVTVVWGITNRGAGPAVGSPFPWTDSVSLFSPVQPEGYSRLVGSWSWPQTNVILPGQTCWTTNTVVLPINKNGDYTLSLTTDVYHDLGQSVEADRSTNVLLSANLVRPNVAPFYLSVEGPLSGLANPRVSVAWGVTNQGAVPAWAGPYGYWVDRLFLSTNSFLDNSAAPLSSWQRKDPVPVGGNYWVTSSNLALPARTAGDYFLILQVDAYNALQRADVSNNIAVAPLKIPSLAPADLAPVMFLAPTIVTTAPNPTLTLVWGITNQGAGTALADGDWSDGVYLSTTPVRDGTERFVGSYPGTNRLAPGEVYWRTNNLRLPVTVSGTYYLIFNSPCYAFVPESDYGNNTATAPITFQITVPDLAPIALQAPGYVTDVPYPRITIVAGVTNRGAGPAFAANDSVYLSATPGRDASARLVAVWPRSATVPPGGTYWLTNSVELPVADSGRYYLVFEADPDNTLGQSDLLNKTAVVPIDLQLSLVPDLVVMDFQVPPFVVGPAKPKVQLVWHVKNQGLGPAARPWADAVSVFTNDGSGYVLLGRFAETNPVPAGGEYWRTNTVTLPVTQSSILSLKLRSDLDDDLYEFAESNNETYATITFTLTTPAPAVILGPGRVKADGSFELAVTGSKGSVYTLQSSTNLLDWARVCDFTCTQETTLTQDPAAAGSGERFYRVVPGPVIFPGQ